MADYETDAVRELSAICATSSTGPVCHFKLINFAKITGALMRLKATYRDMPKGEFLLGIEGYGTLKLFSDGKNAGACLCDEVPEITLDKLTATRFLFGHAPASLIAKIPPHLALWLPLPLFWNLQDRV